MNILLTCETVRKKLGYKVLQVALKFNDNSMCCLCIVTKIQCNIMYSVCSILVYLYCQLRMLLHFLVL